MDDTSGAYSGRVVLTTVIDSLSLFGHEQVGTGRRVPRVGVDRAV